MVLGKGIPFPEFYTALLAVSKFNYSDLGTFWRNVVSLVNKHCDLRRGARQIGIRRCSRSHGRCSGG